MTARTPGRSCPGGEFSYNPATGLYQFNLMNSHATKLAAGNYVFYYTIGKDPTLRELTFTV